MGFEKTDKEVLRRYIQNANRVRLNNLKPEEEKATKYLQIKITKQKKDTFKNICKENNTTPSKQIKKWIDELIKEFEQK